MAAKDSAFNRRFRVERMMTPRRSFCAEFILPRFVPHPSCECLRRRRMADSFV